MKAQVEFFDTDFLGNKIEVGDKVILETPKYRDFAVGTVVSKAPKSCQVEQQSFCTKSNVIVLQYYEQLIKYPIIKEGKWLVAKTERAWNDAEVPYMHKCSLCGGEQASQDLTPYCPYCGAKMLEE